MALTRAESELYCNMWYLKFSQKKSWIWFLLIEIRATQNCMMYAFVYMTFQRREKDGNEEHDSVSTRAWG